MTVNSRIDPARLLEDQLAQATGHQIRVTTRHSGPPKLPRLTNLWSPCRHPMELARVARRYSHVNEPGREVKTLRNAAYRPITNT